MALTEYSDQVSFIRRWMKEGRCRRIGTWSNGIHQGDIWCGTFGNWRIHYETLGRMLRVGSFRVSISPENSMEAEG